MKENNEKWHYFVLTGSEYLVLGYNPRQNDCLVICLSALHRMDQESLEYIVDSEAAQKEAYLVAILNRSPYRVGESWWQHLAERSFMVPISQLENRLTVSQLNVFKDTKQTATTVPPTRETADDILYSPIS